MAGAPASAASTSTSSPSFLLALIAGGLAGTSVDVALFPIDTIKTRLQSPMGFVQAGGFRGVYHGLGAAAVGSAPGAALFFATYEMSKQYWAANNNGDSNGGAPGAHVHMMCASFGEAAACLVRVPTEVIKAKMQTANSTTASTATTTASHNTAAPRLIPTVRAVLAERSGSWLSPWLGGLYRGYGITLFREIPFAMIQFPLYERFKLEWAVYQNKDVVSPVQAAACGSLSGGIAAGITTPLDVLKTRLMLGADKHGRVYTGVGDVWRRTLETEGPKALWSGFQPRVMWISIGGFVFFGAYEGFKRVLSPFLI